MRVQTYNTPLVITGINYLWDLKCLIAPDFLIKNVHISIFLSFGSIDEDSATKGIAT
ncbi:hypothetical protein M422DRAFT_35960 [Sphaerobolus stellatus SS14]|uniref:Uncharacterized protein n=1 Tax=Sphaerobolus stellatus (strain SS14) TaxID=990650 RepID=A0A0C9UEX4_SPHS4|nr:hypothetical protein M422DRAFT_37697 [Sphaerobolus stellatus SS14]KIJ32150.1 hypothetical protein M422DRAFT_35960 [Sphaerobolus stellatus SS14]